MNGVTVLLKNGFASVFNNGEETQWTDPFSMGLYIMDCLKEQQESRRRRTFHCDCENSK